MRDDMGHPVDLGGPARRIVSLVPSLTESIALTRPEALIGATDWCTHPADLDVVRVRGTKNPDRKAIAALEPDLVLANREENRELDIRKLREAGIPVWVTVIETVEEACTSLRRLFSEGLQWDVPDWLDEVERIWLGPVPPIRARVAIPIWRDPWMVVGSSTFTGDLARRLGLDNVFGTAPLNEGGDRYPHVDLADVDRADIDLVLLPDEPYVFSKDDGPEAFESAETVLVSGRSLTWYGPSMIAAHAELSEQLR
ncbi:MAG: helical backbone metal receptor [Actinomycetota bacterium]|nr:helical backbone metal receptor [Actinomycetota bacterium]